MENRIHLDTIDQYNKLYGLETFHPLVSVVDLSKATKSVSDCTFEFDLYGLFLKELKSCDLKYGRRKYDYQEGTIVSFAPGQVVEVSSPYDHTQPSKVLGVVFHPDLIRGTSLGQNMAKYGFFSYSSFEALHLSERERRTIVDCLAKIQEELEHAVDHHSRGLIVMNIELLLNYCLRFYERQFVTREQVNRDVLQRFEKEIADYWELGLPEEKGLPTVAYFADKVCLSPNYFGDLIKKETGKSPQEYIQLKLIDRAKGLIVSTHLTMSEIAYRLGFQYPQHFGRLFKKCVGMTPNEYRSANE